jgi:hypothetical protein
MIVMDRFAIKGVKKLFSLTRTKLRLAVEADTVDTRPRPLPLVKLLSGEGITTVREAMEYRDRLHSLVDYSNPGVVAKTVFELLDIIEGVKYGFEPPELCVLLGEKELKDVEEKAVRGSLPVNLLLLTDKSPPGVNLFVGENPPEDSLHLGRAPSTIAFFLDFAFNSNYLSEDLRLRNIQVYCGRKTLILHAIHFSLEEFGAGLR